MLASHANDGFLLSMVLMGPNGINVFVKFSIEVLVHLLMFFRRGMFIQHLFVAQIVSIAAFGHIGFVLVMLH